MKTIGFIHRGPAYAPELWAYRNFFEQRGFSVKILKEPNEKDLEELTIEWHFTGLDTSAKAPGRLKIHEYVSLSVPPLSPWKNRLKKYLNAKPDARIFGNPFIQKQYGFNDKIPCFYRDAGVASFFFQQEQNENKEFDFVYAGSTDSTRKISRLINAFLKQLPNCRLLIVGTPPNDLSPSIKNQPSLFFTGKIPYSGVPAFMGKARYGINFIPEVYPYRHQRPLKLLEYCAIGLPVITTSYRWVHEFEKERNAHFFKLNPDFSNFRLEEIEAFDFVTPEVSDLRWETIIQQSGILSFLEASV